MHKTNKNINYRPKGKLTGTNVILFKTKDLIEGYDIDFDIKRYFEKEDYDWQKYVVRKVKTLKAPGDHFSMLRKENVHHISTKLKELFQN